MKELDQKIDELGYLTTVADIKAKIEKRMFQLMCKYKAPKSIAAAPHVVRFLMRKAGHTEHETAARIEELDYLLKSIS